MASPALRMGTARGRWVVAAAVLGSGVSFLDSTVVNAALPAIARDLDANLGDLQWVLTGYLLTLGSLLVLGGSLGDRYGRRKIFQIGVLAFAITSLLCAVAPDTGFLIAARCVQGVAAALVVPVSCAAIVPYLPTVVAVVQDALIVVDQIKNFVDGVHVVKPDVDLSKVYFAISRTKVALDAALRATNGVDKLTREQADAAFADFRVAYQDLIALVAPLGVKTGDHLAAAPGTLTVPTPLALKL
jgi:hypothetical protein